jgi:phosphate-selective porin
MMKSRVMTDAIRKLVVIGLLLFPATLWAQDPNEEPPEDPIQSTGHLWQLSFKNRPSLRLGEFFNVDLKAKWHLDFRGFDPNSWNQPGVVTALPETPPTFYIPRSFVGLKGAVTKRVTFEFARDFRQTLGSDHEWHPWKDNYLDFDVTRLLKVAVGKFKMPYGMEANLSEDRLDFAFKSRVSDLLAPSRQRGVMLHAKFLKNDRMEYKVGLFRYDGESTDIHGAPTGKKTIAGAITGEPLRYLKRLPIPKTIRHTYLGFAATRGEMFEGQNGVHGSTFSNFTYFDHLFVNGYRTRLGAEVSWTEGRFSLKGEYMHMSEERKQQGIRGEDLPDEISRGWYVMGSWNVLGKMKSSGKPKNPFLTGHGRGFGAVELDARYDIVAFYSAPGPGLPSRDPRAPTILPNGERTWTFGPTWYLNHFIKIQAHAQIEHLTDEGRKDVFQQYIWRFGIIRLQLAM